MRFIMSKEEKAILKKMLYDYGNEGLLRELIVILGEQADEQSDMGLKEQAHESIELSGMLIKVRSQLKIGRHTH